MDFDHQSPQSFVSGIAALSRSESWIFIDCLILKRLVGEKFLHEIHFEYDVMINIQMDVLSKESRQL